MHLIILSRSAVESKVNREKRPQAEAPGTGHAGGPEGATLARFVNAAIRAGSIDHRAFSLGRAREREGASEKAKDRAAGLGRARGPPKGEA